MAINYGTLLDTGMAMRSYAPAEWDKFVIAVQDYAAATLAEVLRAPPELLLKQQGQATQANEFAGVLAKMPELYEKRQQEMVKKHGRPA